jgi:hypothetical protein
MTTQTALWLSSHPSPLILVRPPVDRLLKHVIVDPLGGGHWFWNDNRRNHRHNTRGHALFTWKVRPSRRTRYESRAEYCVARLFLEHLHGDLTGCAAVVNVCKLPQCVNPAHWSIQYKQPAHRLELTGDHWQLVDHHTCSACADVEHVNIHDGRVVHLARVLPLSRRHETVPLTGACGAIIDVAIARVVTAAVTCTGGC